MSLIEIFTQMDALGIGMFLGSLLFLGGLVWVLVDNKQFDGDVGEVENEVRAAGDAATAGARSTVAASAAGTPSHAGAEDSPRRPPHSRRAA